MSLGNNPNNFPQGPSLVTLPCHLHDLGSLALLLKVSKATLRRWIREERFPKPTFRIGRSLRWSSSALAEVIPGLIDRSQKVEGVSPCK